MSQKSGVTLVVLNIIVKIYYLAESPDPPFGFRAIYENSVLVGNPLKSKGNQNFLPKSSFRPKFLFL